MYVVIRGSDVRAGSDAPTAMRRSCYSNKRHLQVTFAEP